MKRALARDANFAVARLLKAALLAEANPWKFLEFAGQVKADAMVESTHLKNEPWDRTLKEKGEFNKIDYMLAIDSDIVSMPYDEAKERVQERSEMYKIFGAR